MRILFSLIVLTLMLSSTAIHSADVYKWTDEKGNVYYGQTKPKDYKFTAVNAPPPPPLDSPDLNKPFADQIRGKAKESASDKKPQSEMSADDKTRNCKAAQTNLNQLQTNPRIRVKNADGTSAVMPEDQRQAKMAESKKQIEYFCK